MLALLCVGLARVGVGGTTNNVSAQVRNQMASTGYTVAQKTISLPRQNTHSLRNLHFVGQGPFLPLVVPAKRTGWSLWNNSSFKSVGRNSDQPSLLAPYSVLTQYEYEITYTFEF